MDGYTHDENAAEHSGSSSSGAKLSKDIVSAWFVTVFNPMIDALALQKKLLEERNYTWRYRTSEFEALGRPSDRIEVEYLPNLEHVLDFYPQILTKLNDHGNQIEKLRQTCADLQHVLEHSVELQKLYTEATSDAMVEEYGRTLERMFGAYPEQDHRAYLAQLIINRTATLPDYYTVYPLWNRFRDQFIELLQKPVIREYEQKVCKEGEGLLSVTTSFLEMVKQIRKDLALKHGVPFVMPSVRVT